jgi:hypothetical protein
LRWLDIVVVIHVQARQACVNQFCFLYSCSSPSGLSWFDIVVVIHVQARQACVGLTSLLLFMFKPARLGYLSMHINTNPEGIQHE